MVTKQKRPTDPYRRSLYAKIEVAKKQLAIDDDSYRDILRRRYARSSRRQLVNAQLVDLIEHFKSLGFKPAPRTPKRAGRRPLAQGSEARKIRALWLAGYHLGVVRDPSEAALGRFVKRVSGGGDRGVDALQWLHGKAAEKVIEALKDWLRREGGVNWEPYRIGAGFEVWHKPRARVVEAQWRRLNALGVVHDPSHEALSRWLRLTVGLRLPEGVGYILADDEGLDRVIEALGARIRRAAAKERAQ